MSTRSRASFSKATEVQWSRYQAIRHVLAEPHQRLIGPGSTWLPHDGPSALVADDILLLALHSELLGDWASVWPIWDAFIRRSCPAVAQRVSNLISDTTNWWDFCRKLHHALDNRHEDTTSPLSILHVLIEAEDWFVAEHECQDRRATDNAHRIVALFDAGVSASKISQQLGLSRQYVYRYLKSSISTRKEAALPIEAGVEA